jgi:integrase
VAALRAHKARQTAERLAGPEWLHTGLVFHNQIGGPTDRINRSYCEYKPLQQTSRLGDESFTFYSLRNTFATELFNQHKRPKIIQSLLRHSSITQAMDTYSHLLDNVDDEIGGLDETIG